MWRSDDAGLVESRGHPDRVERSVIVVRDTVAPMDGNIHFVGSCNQAQTLDDEFDLAVTREFPRLSSLDVGVRTVTAHAVRTEERHAEDKIVERPVCPHSRSNSKCLSRFKDVGRDAVGSHKLDSKDLGLAGAPTSFDSLRHV